MAQPVNKVAKETPDQTFETLKLDLTAEDYRVRSAAVGALGKIGDARAVSLITRALGDPRKRVRARAVRRSDAFAAPTR